MMKKTPYSHTDKAAKQGISIPQSTLEAARKQATVSHGGNLSRYIASLIEADRAKIPPEVAAIEEKKATIEASRVALCLPVYRSLASLRKGTARMMVIVPYGLIEEAAKSGEVPDCAPEDFPELIPDKDVPPAPPTSPGEGL